MAVQPEAVRPLATKTPFGMAIIPQRLLLKGALWLRSSGHHAPLWLIWATANRFTPSRLASSGGADERMLAQLQASSSREAMQQQANQAVDRNKAAQTYHCRLVAPK